MRREVFTNKKKKKKADNKPGDDSIGTNPEIPGLYKIVGYDIVVVGDDWSLDVVALKRIENSVRNEILKKHRNIRTDSYVKKLIILLTYCLLFVSLINTHV